MSMIPALDELAAATMLVEPSNNESYQELVSLAKTILGTLGDDAAVRSMSDCIRALDFAWNGKAEERARAISKLADWISSEGQESGVGTETAVQARGVFVRPSWVDATVLEEFVSERKLWVEETEALLLEAESRGPEVASNIKRSVHTIKGEAGALGLDDIVIVCHAWESWLDSPYTPGWVDKQLKVCDWLPTALTSYAEGRYPEPSGEMIAESLKNVEAQSEEQPAVAPAAPRPVPEAPPVAASAVPAAAGEASAVERDEETVALLGEFITETEEGAWHGGRDADEHRGGRGVAGDGECSVPHVSHDQGSRRRSRD